MDHFKDFIEREMPQDEPGKANTFQEMLWGLLGGEDSILMRETELWGDICRDQPEIELTPEEKHALRSWAYGMIIFSGIVDRMADVIERAVHLGYCYGKREYC